MAPLSPSSCPSLIPEEDDSDYDEVKCPRYQTLDRGLEAIEDKKHSVRRRRRSPLSSSATSSSSSPLESNDGLCACVKEICGEIPLTTTLPLLVFIDMFAVALVVPLLFQYYQSAGVATAGQRELLSSIFSSAQIVGGILLGAFIDAQWLRRRTVLFLSFGGSAVAYALMAHGSLSALVFSRVLVGLVKQTMTISKTMLTRSITEGTRAFHLGRLSASATAAWVVGPSVGAVLFKFADYRAPALLASGLFLLNMVLAALLLPEEDEDDHLQTDNYSLHAPSTSPSCNRQHCCSRSESGTLKPIASDVVKHSSNSKGSCAFSFASNLQSCFASRELGSLVFANLVVTWVARATNSNTLSTFYEDLYGLEPHFRGYISSYQQILGFFVEFALITPFLRWSGGERKATCVCALFLAVALGLQLFHSTSLAVFLGLVCPLTSLGYSIMFTSLQTLVTTVAPMETIFSVLAAMDVLQNAVSVTVPFYRTMMFARLAGDRHAVAEAIDGDPDPNAWLCACTIHWFAAAVALSLLLLSTASKCCKHYGRKNVKRD